MIFTQHAQQLRRNATAARIGIFFRKSFRDGSLPSLAAARALRMALLSACCGAGPCMAHAVGGLAGQHGGALRLAWSFDPLVLCCLALSGAAYGIGLLRLWGHAGGARGVSVARALCYWAGWLTLIVALVSPLDPLGERLFSAHMVQHELLMLVAAPLFVLGRPLGVWVWAMPRGWRRAVGIFFHRPAWRVPWLFLTGPLVAWVLHALALWLWHVPALFQAALENDSVHTLQHSSFFLSALLFWWTVLAAPTRRAQGIALLSLFTTMVHMGALGALITLAAHPWYAGYLHTTSVFHLTPLEDQQLGGLIMWVPSGGIYLACMVAIAARWLDAPPRAVRGGA